MAENFELATEVVKSFVDKLNDQTQLQIYVLYKQATVGDINIGKPTILDQKGKQNGMLGRLSRESLRIKPKLNMLQLLKPMPRQILQKFMKI